MRAFKKIYKGKNALTIFIQIYIMYFIFNDRNSLIYRDFSEKSVYLMKSLFARTADDVVNIFIMFIFRIVRNIFAIEYFNLI